MSRTREFLEKLMGRNFEYFEVWDYWANLPYFVRIQVWDRIHEQTMYILYPDSIELDRLHKEDWAEEEGTQRKKMALEVMSQEEIDRIDEEIRSKLNVDARDS